MTGDRARVLSLINAAWTTQVVAAACELAVADSMGDETMTAPALAGRIQADADAVARLLRAMVTLGLCTEDADERFALTDDGALLRSAAPHSLSAWARLSGSHIWTNWSQLASSIARGESARVRLQGTDDFSYLERNATAAELFNTAMVDLTRPIAEAAARQLDWRTVKMAFDVGGGTGELLATLLEAHPSMRGRILDLPHAEAAAKRHLRARGLEDRCDFLAVSFFDPLPKGADAFLLKSVLHNWDDARAGAILRRCREAATGQTRVIVLERVVPERLSRSSADADVARSDLNMLVGCGGRERTLREFEALLQGAGLRLLECRALVNGMWAMQAAPHQA